MPAKTGQEERSASSDQYDIEKIAKILSLVAIPVVLAIFGWLIQNRLSERNVSQEYVKLAVSVLEKQKSAEVPAGLRDWAVDLLNQNSPTKFSADTIRQLKSGDINLAGVLSQVLATTNNGSGIAISPDGKTVATGQDDGRVAVWDRESGRQLFVLVGHKGPVTAVVYGPDGKDLFSGSSDGEVFVWDVAHARPTRKFSGSSPIIGFAVSPDGRSLLVRSADRKVKFWDLQTMQLLHEYSLVSPET
jgi:WD40 repeat protein